MKQTRSNEWLPR